MNEKVKELWLQALRTGKFRQGKRRLTLIDQEGTASYCCLGVLCKLAVDAGVIPEPEKIPYVPVSFLDPQLFGNYFLVYEGSDGILPDAVSIWAGLDNGNPTVTNRYYPLTLAELNDAGTSFDEIANVIEKEL